MFVILINSMQIDDEVVKKSGKTCPKFNQELTITYYKTTYNTHTHYL